jgi:nucleoside-diphosphate-sugar epimerase
MAYGKTISILGCGWYGLALASALIDKGFLVKGSTTRTEKLSVLKEKNIKAYLANFEADKQTYNDDLFKCDVLIISIPPKRSSGEATSYTKKIERIKHAILAAGITRVLFISSTGVYGDHHLEVDEDTSPRPESVSGNAIYDAENLLRDQTGFKATILRFGGLVGPGRDPGRFFAGKKDIPNGKAPVNLIHLSDCIGITKAIIEQDAFGCTFNACSPEHPRKMDFYTAAARKSQLELPHFVDELREWKVVGSKYLVPVLNYSFKASLS